MKMKSSLVRDWVNLWRTPQYHFPLLLLMNVWLGVSAARAQAPATVWVWGTDYHGLTSVPIAAQTGQRTVPADLTGVVAIAAGEGHTVALLGSGAMTPVSLTLRPSGNEMIVSWPAEETGFTLQSTPNLTPPVTWTDVTNPPTPVLGGQNVVTNPVSGGAQFFRPIRP